MSSVITLEPVTAAYYIKEQTVLEGEKRTGRLSGGGCRCVCVCVLVLIYVNGLVLGDYIFGLFLCAARGCCALVPLVNTSLTNMALANQRTTHTHTCCL